MSLPILMYHHISPAPGLVTHSPETFLAHMRYLAQNGWHTLGSDALADFLSGKPIPKKSVVITFDDGYLDNYLYAHPVLERFKQKALLFIVTGWIGEGAVRKEALCPDHKTCKACIRAGDADSVILRWSEIEAMQQSGTFEFHSHTHTHTRFDALYQDLKQREDALHADLTTSTQTLITKLGMASAHFAWPQGFYQESYLPIAQSFGFDYIYTTEKRPLSKEGNALKIGRLVAKNKGTAWLARTLWLHTHPLIGRTYLRLQGSLS